MKKVLLILIIACSCLSGKAQVSYGDNFFVDYNVQINLSTENDSIFLTLILTSERFKMSDSPKLLLRLMDDSVISLDGYMLGATNKSEGAVMIGYTAVAINHYVTEAKFPISKDLVDKLSKGVKKLRLNTSPKFHEKEWRKDKIGKFLYKKYVESSSNSFEDGF
jgi:hypothetical protein